MQGPNSGTQALDLPYTSRTLYNWDNQPLIEPNLPLINEPVRIPHFWEIFKEKHRFTFSCLIFIRGITDNHVDNLDVVISKVINLECGQRGDNLHKDKILLTVN